jgi:apolipoprotein D and lipocalin family protein
MLRRILPTALLTVACACAPSRVPQVVSTVDLGKYAGCWYELATKPMFVQRKCTGTTAEYRVLDSTTVSVVNSCRWEGLDGELREVRGRATVSDPAVPGKLEVRFDTWWGMFARGDYWVLLLDPRYRWSVVGGPDPDRLWILSRTPTIPEADKLEILTELQRRGVDLSGLRWTLQPSSGGACGAELTVPSADDGDHTETFPVT